MASYTALMNIQVDSQQAQLGINNLNKNLTYLSRSSRLTNKSLLQMQQTFLRIENTINQATGNTASFNAKMQQATNIIKKLRGEVSSLRSEVDNLNKKLKGTNGPLDKQRTLWERLSGALQRNQYFTSLAISALAGFVSQRLVGGIIRITDEYTLMENKIKTVTPTVDGVARSMESVYRVAQETRQPLAIVANLYSRIGRNSKELQQNLSALVDITSTVSKAFQLGGATIEESRNAMVQFSQALASGRLQGDELRSILELAPVLAENISKSIGITTGSLRRLASEGLITTEVLIKALLEAGKDIRTQFANFTPTVSQSFETVSNSFIKLIGSNQKFKDANEVLGNQLRKFASALDEQGSLANKLGDAYLMVARNVDVLAAALAGLAVVIAGAGIAGLVALLASSPVVASITGLAAIATGIGAYAVSASSAEEETSKLVDSTKNLLKILSDTDMKTLSEKNVADIQADIMGKQAGIQRLISETRDEIKQLDDEIADASIFDDFLAKVDGLIGAPTRLLFDIDEREQSHFTNIKLAKEERELAKQRLEDLQEQANGLKKAYDDIAEAEQEGALKAMLARTKALEMQKRQLKKQEMDEQLAYYEKMGAGASDRSLQDIQFANQAAQKLRQELSKLQMASLNTAFVGMFSVKQLFGGTDPAAAVDNINDKMREFISITEKDEAGGIVKFFTDYLGTGGPEGEKAIKEITEKLTKEPFLAKNLRQAMISVWQGAAAEYTIYAAKRKAEDERYLNDLLKDMRYEYQVMAAENNSDRARLMAYLVDGVTLHNKEALAIHYKITLEKKLQRLQMEKEERSEDAIIAAEKEIDRKKVLYENALATKNEEEAINKVLQNRETIFENQSRAKAEVSVGGTESYGGAVGMEVIGSSIRDQNIEYQTQIDLLDRIYKANSPISGMLKNQAATIRDQNIQREIALKLENLKLEAARQAQSNILLAEQIDLEESGLSSAEVRVGLIQKETELQFSALDAMVEAGNLESERADQLKRGLGNLMLQRVEAEKLNNIREALLATKNERAIGNAVIDGISALISGDFYKSIWNSLSSGATNLVQSIQNINWGTFGEDFANKIKNIDWKGIALDFGKLFKSAGGLLEAAATVGGQSGQRALNISKAAEQGFIAGGPQGAAIATLGAAIMSNEKVQQALSKLFDAVFEFIDPFLDLLGPVVDIFTAMLKNNPIMIAVKALKPLLENLGTALGALASAIDSLDLSQQGGTLGYIFGGGLASDFEDNIGSTVEGFFTGFSMFESSATGVIESFQRTVEEVMGSRYFKVSSQMIKAGLKDFRDVYEQGYEAAKAEVVYETVNTGGDDTVIKRPYTEAELEKFARDTVFKALGQVLDGIVGETEAVLDEAQKLTETSFKTDLENATDSIKVYRGLIDSIDETAFIDTNQRAKLKAFVEAQEEYFAAFTKNEILTATKDLEESILSFQRMVTDPLTQSKVGLDSFTNQVTEFQKAIDEVSDPAKKAALQENLKEFTNAFEYASDQTAAGQVEEISLRGVDITAEQELELQYKKEIAQVQAQENLTNRDKIRVIKELNDAKRRELAMIEREQELLNLRGVESALQEILSTFEKTIDGINDLIQSLYDQVQDLLFGEFNLDPYLQKFELASDTYGALLASAFDPDATEDDIEKLQQFVNTYLGTARDLYKSSSTFQQIFSNVLSDLSVLGVQAGFNMPQVATGTATSGIQDFIDTTEDLSDTLEEQLTGLVSDLDGLRVAFAQQRINFIQGEMEIPLKITNDMIVVDLGSVQQKVTLTNDNFIPDTTRLNLAESFESIEFNPDFGELTDETGWQNYEKTATFKANLLGWDPFAGRAEYSAIATFKTDIEDEPETYGWKAYSQTASFSAILSGWNYHNGGPYRESATFEASFGTRFGGIGADSTYGSGWQEYVRSAIFRGVLEGWPTAVIERSAEFSGKYGVDEGWHSNYSATAIFSGTYGYDEGWRTHYASATFSPTGLVDSISKLETEIANAMTSTASAINSTIDTFIDSWMAGIEKTKTVTNYQKTLDMYGFAFSTSGGDVKQGGGRLSQDEYYRAKVDKQYADEYKDYLGISGGSPTAPYTQQFGYIADEFDYYFTIYKKNGDLVSEFYKNLMDAAFNFFLHTWIYQDTATFNDPLGIRNSTEYEDMVNWYMKASFGDDYQGPEGYMPEYYLEKNFVGYAKGGLVVSPMDTIPAMLSPGEYIMSKGAVDSLGIGTLNSLNAGDLSALRQTGDPEVRRLLRELIVAVQTSDTEVNVYTDTKGETKAAINEFRTELRERSRRQGEKYVNVRYV